MSALPHPAAHGPGPRALHLAWWSLLLFPLSLGAAFVAGEGIPALWGYSEPSLDSTPWWVITMAVGAAVLILAAPLPVTAHFSRQARAAGEPNARLPLMLAIGAIAAFVALNLAGGLAQLLAS